MHGDINIESSRVCHCWANSQHPFEYTEFNGINHRQIVSDEAVLRAIGNIVGVTNQLDMNVLCVHIKILHYRR